MFCPREPDHADLDEPEGRYGFCAQCETNVHAVRMDFGVGCYEYWGARYRHVDWCEVCPVCLGDLTGPQMQDDQYEEES
jgi:hypothetical protein